MSHTERKAAMVEECRNLVEQCGGYVAASRYLGVERRSAGSIASWPNTLKLREIVTGERLQPARELARAHYIASLAVDDAIDAGDWDAARDADAHAEALWAMLPVPA